MTSFFTIEAATCYLDRPMISSLHSILFHGLAERGGKEYPFDVDLWADSSVDIPLLISRSSSGIPSVFKPSANLVVDHHIAESLKRKVSARLVQVQFKRLVDIGYAKGDFSWTLRWGEIDPKDIMRSAAPTGSKKVGPYFEVLSYRMKDIAPQCDNLQNIECEVGTPPMHEIISIGVSRDMFVRFPIVWNRALFVNEDVFQVLAKWLDEDFFVVRKHTL